MKKKDSETHAVESKKEQKKEEKKAEPVVTKKKEEKSGTKKRKTRKNRNKGPDFDEEFEERSYLAYILGALIILGAVFVIFQINYAPEEIVIPKDVSGVNTTVEIELYSSFNCKPCYETFQTMQKLKIMYGEALDIKYKHFPIDIDFDFAPDKSSFCSEEIREKLFIGTYDEKSIEKLADSASFSDCLADRATSAAVLLDYKEGLEKEIDTLPTVFVNGDKVIGNKPLPVYEIIVDTNLGLLD